MEIQWVCNEILPHLVYFDDFRVCSSFFWHAGLTVTRWLGRRQHFHVQEIRLILSNVMTITFTQYRFSELYYFLIILCFLMLFPPLILYAVVNQTSTLKWSPLDMYYNLHNLTLSTVHPTPLKILAKSIGVTGSLDTSTHWISKWMKVHGYHDISTQWMHQYIHSLRLFTTFNSIHLYAQGLWVLTYT